MKDAVITVRLPKATRSRIERLAQAEGRSLSQQVERLIETAIGSSGGSTAAGRRRIRPLAGAFRGSRIPTLSELRATRMALSRSLESRIRGHVAR